MLEAATIWIMVVFNVAALFSVVVAADITIMHAGGVTITDWLRTHPGWFWWPMSLYIAFFIVLGAHLYGR